jgi:hypothetical protein
MKYDDASWHYGGDFPDGLPDEAGATHIGMFVSWCQLNGVGGELHSEDFPEMLEKLKSREITPAQWFMSACDEKFTDEDLSELGNKFTLWYYESDPAPYISDYESVCSSELESLYHVPDTWSTYEKLAPVILNQFEQWQGRG